MIPYQNVRLRIEIEKQTKFLDEPKFDGNNVQLNVDQQSYGKQSIPNDSDNVIKSCGNEIKKAREILEQRECIVKGSSKKSKQQNTTSRNDTPRGVMRQQTQSARGMDTRTRSQSQTHKISLGNFNSTRQSLTRFAGPLHCRITEIIKPNDPRADCPK